MPDFTDKHSDHNEKINKVQLKFFLKTIMKSYRYADKKYEFVYDISIVYKNHFALYSNLCTFFDTCFIFEV